MKIAILGAGRMGSLIGADAARAGADVYLVDPYKEQIDAINEKGVTIHLNEDSVYNVKCKGFYSADEIKNKMDLVIIQVIGPYTEAAVKGALNLFDENTYCLTLQNGMGNVEILQEYLPAEKVLYGIIHFACTMISPGEIKARINAGDDVPFCCSASEEPDEFMKEFAALMNSAGHEFVAAKRSVVDKEQWLKLAKNCSSNGVCCVTRLPLGPCNESEEGFALKLGLFNEARAVAAARGIELPDIADTLKVTRDNKIYYHVSSTGQDVKAKKKTEIDYISGYVAREGERLGVPTPLNSLLTTLVHIIQENYDLQF